MLSLTRDGDAYAVPVAYRYDGTTLRFRLADDGTSTKSAFADATETASFIAYGYESADDSWSIIATGPIRRLPEEAWEDDRGRTRRVVRSDQSVRRGDRGNGADRLRACCRRDRRAADGSVTHSRYREYVMKPNPSIVRVLWTNTP
ncbi:pyridoxamine 5'-phosphate oxidase family protein [Halobaculum rubrum]|uniref:pyridoxamine 5'-phosphate oxidase family protein n=1 Tax=Halobaculum rubrum TaxID=2872158 RepID=UPI0031F3358A